VGAILLGLAGGITTPLAAFAGALGATGLVYGLARGRHGMQSERLLLTGVIVNAFLSSLILLLNHLAPPARRLKIFDWLTGNLGAVGFGPVERGVLAAVAALSLLVFLARARDLDLLSLGEREAATLGVDVGRTRALLFFAGS